MTDQTRRQYLKHALTASTIGAGGKPLSILGMGWEASERWQRSFDTAVDQEAYGLVHTRDGGFVVASYAGGPRTTRPSKLWLVKFQASGDVVWKRRIGSVGGERTTRALALSEAGDGSLIVGTKAGGLEVMKTSPAGRPQWLRAWAGDVQNVERVNGPLQVAGTADGGCVVAGWMHLKEGTDSRSVVATERYEPTGERRWRRYATLETFQTSMLAAFASDDGVYVASNADDSFRVDDFSTPDVQNVIDVNLTEDPQGHDYVSASYANAVRLDDGGYLATGPGPGAVRFDTDGNAVWSNIRKIGNKNAQYENPGLCVSENGLVVNVGYTKRQGTRPGWIVVMDESDGTIVATHRFTDLDGGSAYRKAQHVVPSPKGFMVAGYRSSKSGLDTSLWVGDVAVRDDPTPDLPQIFGGLGIAGAGYWAYQRRTSDESPDDNPDEEESSGMGWHTKVSDDREPNQR